MPDVRQKIEDLLSYLIEQEGFHLDIFTRHLFNLDIDLNEVIVWNTMDDHDYGVSIKFILEAIYDYYTRFRRPPNKAIILKEVQYGGIERVHKITEILNRIQPPEQETRLISNFSSILSDLVMEASRRKAQNELLPALNKTLSERDIEKFSKTLEGIGENIGRLVRRFSKIGVVEGGGAVPASFLVSENLRREAPPGIPTGLPSYDRLFGGIKKSELVLFLARTGVGKTMFALFVLSKLISDGYRVYFLSKEMDWESVETRLLAHFTGIPILKIERRLYNDEEEKQIIEALGLLREIGKNLAFSPGRGIRTVRDLYDDILKSKRFFGDSLAEVVIVDYLNLLDPFGEKTEEMSNWLKQAQVAQDLKDLAQSLDLPVIALAQANVEARKKVKADDPGIYLAYSKYIANPADVILMFWNDENVPPAKPLFATDYGTPGIIHARVIKGRNIGTGWEFSFEVEWSILSIQGVEGKDTNEEIKF